MAQQSGVKHRVAGRQDVYLNSLEAEQAVLGGLLLDGMAIWELRTYLQPADFCCQGHDELFDAMLAVADSGKGIDLVTVSDELERRGMIDKVGGAKGFTGRAYVANLPMVSPTSVHVEYHARIVRDLALRRGLTQMAQRVAVVANDGETGDAALTKALTWFGALAKNTAVRLRTSTEAVEDFSIRLTDWLEDPRDVWGLPTGIRDLDSLTGGLERSEFVIIAGRPSMGKSALALQIARHVAELGHGVVFFSLEMGMNQLIMRLACSGARVNSRKVRAGQLSEDQKQALWADLGHIQNLPVHWSCRGGITVQEATNEVAKLQARQDVSLVVFDYIGLASATGESQNVRVSKTSQGLKRMAVSLDVCVIGVSQLNRAIEMRATSEPKLSDLRDSGSLEQDADKVLFLHQEDGTAKVVLAKNRNGAAGIGLRELVFLKQYAVFADMARV